MRSFCVAFQASSLASRGWEDDAVGLELESDVGGAGDRVERRVSGNPGADGAVVEDVEWVVRLLVDFGCDGRGAIRRDWRMINGQFVAL